MHEIPGGKLSWMGILEPVTIQSGWDLRSMEVQNRAMAYIEAAAPDLIVLAWPCGPWSPLQALNQKTPNYSEARPAGQATAEPPDLFDFCAQGGTVSKIPRWCRGR